ncbi:hypothetical protein BaOVIS_029460 [Babesia ovis]|uniref:Uncharacterized protein n=1 Tax=Babesia ovis TaxID=5869 RepID=A0A9W5WWJ2_BABOV|nr:hypothetical protein BaOVIS_029460 [Babesia ovis]
MVDGELTGKRASSSAAALDRILIRRGAALQTLVAVSERNSLATQLKRFAFNRLKSHATGGPSQPGVSDDTSSLRFNQSQLRLLRQEQLMLMAENERLVYELQEIRRCRSTGQFRPSQPRSVPEFRQSKLSKAIDLTLSGGRDNRLSAARASLLCALITKLRHKVLGAAFRALGRQSNKLVRFSAASNALGPVYTKQQMTIPCMILENIIRSLVHRTKRLSLYLLKNGTREKLPPSRRGMVPAVGLPQADSRPAGMFI